METIALDPEIREALYKVGLKECADDAAALRFWGSLTGDNRTKIDELGATFDIAIDDDALEILNCAQHGKLPDSFGVERVLNNVPKETAFKEVYKAVAATKRPISIANPTDNSGGPTSFADAIALRVSAGKPLRNAKGEETKSHGYAHDLARRPMIEIGKQYLAANGVSVDTLSKPDLQKMLWSGRNVVGLHSTSDFPNVLANSLNKVALRAYMEAPAIWQKFCKRGSIADFKTATRANLGEVPNLAQVYEGGTYTEFTIGDRKEQFSMTKFGKRFSLTWESFINDDLSIFDRLPAAIMQAARRLENTKALAILTNGTSTSSPYVMGDAHALFDSTYHSNLETTTAAKTAPTVAALNSARLRMSKQTGISTDVLLDIQPYCIIAPRALQSTVEVLLASENDPAVTTVANVANPWRGKLEAVFHPLLDADSSTKWYLSADPAIVDTIELAFLEGYESPTFEALDQTSPDRREYYIRHCVAAKALDWRGLHYNAGA